MSTENEVEAHKKRVEILIEILGKVLLRVGAVKREKVSGPELIEAAGKWINDSPYCAPCDMRKKILIGVFAVLPESDCGVPESVLADFIDFDMNVPSGKPVVRVRFCSWCGKLVQKDTTRKTDLVKEPEPEPSP